MKYGLMGWPVAHSKSPELFREAYHDNPEMTYDLIEESDFEVAWQRFLDGYQAVNVTAPFKAAAYRRVDISDTITRELFAVNIVKKHNGLIYGYNSDFWAIQKLLEPIARQQRSRVMVIGCGGAAKAAALAAQKLRLPVMVANRDFAKVRDFCFSRGGMVPLRLDQVEEHAQEAGILVYALPLEIELVERLPLAGKVVVEANYKNPCLPDRCQEAGATYIPGFQWLTEQAASGYKLMTGVAPDIERVKACSALWL